LAARTDLLPLPISESLEVGKFGQVSLAFDNFAMIRDSQYTWDRRKNEKSGDLR